MPDMRRSITIMTNGVVIKYYDDISVLALSLSSVSIFSHGTYKGILCYSATRQLVWIGSYSGKDVFEKGTASQQSSLFWIPFSQQ